MASRAVLLAPAAAGAGLLLSAEPTTLRVVRAGGTPLPGASVTAGAHHGYALAVLAVAMLVMAWGAGIGGSRPAAVALLVLAAAAAGIVLLADLPALGDAGLVARTYELASAGPGTGFWLECAGAALALGAGAAAVAATAPAARRGRALSRS